MRGPHRTRWAYGFLRMAGTVTLVLALAPLARAAEPPKVDKAIDRGVRWLVQEQRPNGSWGGDAGKSVLAVVALQHAGVRVHTPGGLGRAMRRAWKWLDRFGPGAKKREPKAQTYACSLMLLALDVRNREEDATRLQRLADWLAQGQVANGQWSYDLAPGGSVGDNSNTQFAVLALGRAWGRGLRVPRTTLEKARAWWQGTLQERGGFGYASGGARKSAPKHSMTAAGISSLAILDSALRRAAEPPTADVLLTKNDVLRRAYQWLTDAFSLTPTQRASRRKGGGVAGQSWPHYYLWTLERALVLLGVREIAGIDWFEAGTEKLLASQKKDGSWRGEAPLYATSFALLFLTRAADPPRVFTHHGPITGGVREPSETTKPAEGTVQEWLRAGRPRPDIARDCRTRGPTALLDLADALDDPDAKVRQKAYEGLFDLMRSHRVRGVDRHPLPRARLQMWLRRHVKALTYDWKIGRFTLPAK